MEACSAGLVAEHAEVAVQQPYFVIPIRTVLRLLLFMSLLVALLIVVMSAPGNSGPSTAVGAPSTAVSVDEQH